MKKIIFTVVVGYIFIAGGLLLINQRESFNEVKILTVKKMYSRVITENELLDIPIYLNEENSFLMDETKMTDIRLSDETNELEINIQAIKAANQKINYQGNQYDLFYYQIDFSEVQIINMSLNFTNAILNITYENEETIELEIGNVNLLFNSIENHPHLDFTRMFSITNKENGYDVIKALYLELDNRTGEEIIINEINFLEESIQANISEIKSINFMPEYNTNFNGLLPNFISLIDEYTNELSYSIIKKQNLLIPIHHIDDWHYINRFPLIINYTYNDNNYDYIIDDYLFFSSINDIENDDYEKSIYTYQY